MKFKRLLVLLVTMCLVGAGGIIGADAMSKKKVSKITAKNISAGGSGISMASTMHLGDDPNTLTATIAHSKEATDLHHADFRVWISCRTNVDGEFDSEFESFDDDDITISSKNKASFKVNVAKEFDDQFTGSYHCYATVTAELDYDFDEYDYPNRPPEVLQAKKVTLTITAK